MVVSPPRAAALPALLLLAGGAAGLGLGARAGANPIRKVVTLMQDMQKEIETEVAAEKQLFEKFMCICTEYPSELKDTIDEATKSSEDLTGAIESESAEKSRLAEELKVHGVEKAAAEQDLSQAGELREKEAAQSAEEVAGLKASIAGLAKAIPVLEKGAAASLLQSPVVEGLEATVKSTSLLSGWQKDKVTAFLAGGAGAGDSGEVVGILKQMSEDMTKSLADAEKAEQVAVEGFAGLKDSKDKEIAVVAQAIEEKEKQSGALAVSIEQSKDALEEAGVRKTDAQKMLSTLTSTCAARKLEFEAHFKTRADEVAAVSETIAILTDDDALDIFKKAAPSLVQGSKVGLVQAHSDSFQALENLRLALRRVRATRQSSRQAHLAEAAQAPAEKETELEKIPGGMIENLEKEKEDDAKKKAFCQDEITKAHQEEKARQDALDAIDAQASALGDEIEGIAGEVAAIEKEIGELDRTVALATEQRKKEHAEYAESLAMADAAVALLAKAKNRLQKFYNPTLYKAEPKKEMTMEEKILSAGGSSFAQTAQRQMPDLPTVPTYEKKNSGGVLALIDKLSQDLVADKSQSTYDEKTAQKDYAELMKESSESRAASQKSMVEKRNSRAGLETRLLEAKESKSQIFQELANAHELTDTLHKTCDFILDHFEDREEARKGEVEKLKSAKELLHKSS